MSVIASFSVPGEEFVLGEMLAGSYDGHVRLESMVPMGESVIPYVWVPAEDADAFEAVLRDAPSIESVSVVDRTGEEALLRVDWADPLDGLVGVVRDSGAVILEGRGRAEQWSFRVRFSERDDLSAFYRACVDEGLSVDVGEVNEPMDSSRDRALDVTEAQREALVVALEGGYFAVPRGMTLEELAARLEISDTAASQRLRRGLSTLLTGTLMEDAGDGAV